MIHNLLQDWAALQQELPQFPTTKGNIQDKFVRQLNIAERLAKLGYTGFLGPLPVERVIQNLQMALHTMELQFR